MTVQYGCNCVSQMEVYESVQRFIGGRTSGGDERSERPSIVTYIRVKKQLYQRIRDN